MKTLSVPDKHQLRIARATLKMSDAAARFMGGPSKAEAVEIIERLTGAAPHDVVPYDENTPTLYAGPRQRKGARRGS